MEYYLNLFSGRQFVDSNGDPYNGAKLFIYSAGSSTKVTTYKDNAGASSHANPIILNARGEPADGAGASQPIWQEAGVDVKLVLAPANDTDPPVSAISTWDNIGGINDASAVNEQWIVGPTPTYVSTTSFTLVGDQSTTFHVGRRVKTTNSGGTIYSTISAVSYTTLTTVTVVNDSGVLDSGISAVYYAVLTAVGTSTPSVKVSGLDWTHQGQVTMSGKSFWMAEGAAVASANDCNIWTTDGNTVHITDANEIQDWGTAPQAGAWKWAIFDSTPQLTYHATTNKLNTNGANYTAVAGDRALVYADDTGTFVVTIFPLNGSQITKQTADIQTFTSSGTWTKPSSFASTSKALLQAWGGGGGGANGGGIADVGGGGGGAYMERWVTLSDMGATETITIGAGGAGAAVAASGANGGTTTIGSLLTAYGGAGGETSNGASGDGGGGGGALSAGSSSTGGTLGGGTGGVGTATGGVPTTTWGGAGGAGVVAAGGNSTGGAAVWGGGGGSASSTTAATAGGASLFGGAGGFEATAGSQPGGGGGARKSAAGSNGGAGKVIITVFV